MRLLFLCILCFTLSAGTAQKKQLYPSPDDIVITGLVKKEVRISFNDIKAMPDTTFTLLKIVNHRGELKTTYQQVKAVLLKKLLEDKLISTAKPKELSSFYFLCRAMDNYTAVYSYNELFNAPADAVFIVTAYDNFDIDTMPEKPVIMSLTGNNSGRFGMRGLASIEVKKGE